MEQLIGRPDLTVRLDLDRRLQAVRAAFKNADMSYADTLTSDADLESYVEWWETRRDFYAAQAIEEMGR
jgi:hypothetical protein